MFNIGRVNDSLWGTELFGIRPAKNTSIAPMLIVQRKGKKHFSFCHVVKKLVLG